jgi:hypothetical protein
MRARPHEEDEEEELGKQPLSRRVRAPLTPQAAATAPLRGTCSSILPARQPQPRPLLSCLDLPAFRH